MLTFAARCTRCGCYVADGVGWGGVGCCRSLQDVHAVDATLPMGWGGVGWGGMLTFGEDVHRNPGLDNVLKALKNFRARTNGVMKPTEAFNTPLWKVL